MTEPILISFKDAAFLCGLSPSTLRDRKAGTHGLTHVPFGRRTMLIRSEVVELIEFRIAQARADERKRQKTLRLIHGGI